MSGEYEHPSSKNMGSSDGPAVQSDEFLENGCNDTDQISAIDGDHLPK
jgi:hypothetical protein